MSPPPGSSRQTGNAPSASGPPFAAAWRRAERQRASVAGRRSPAAATSGSVQNRAAEPLPAVPAGSGARRARRRSGAAAALAVWSALAAAGCGYHLANHAHALPPDVKVIAVPGFQNHTLVPQLSQLMTAAMTQELIQRTHYRIQPRRAGSDAVLEGVVLSLDTTPVTFDPNTGRVSTVEVRLRLRVQLRDETTGKALYQASNMVFRDQYQISPQAQTLIEEDTVTLRRICRDAARTVVGNILENF